MAKRRRGARSAGARPRPSRHRPFESLVELALASIPEPFASALDEVAIVIDDEPTADQRRENEIEDDDTLYGLYEGVPRTEWGADWAASAKPDHPVPPAARGGLRRSRRARRRGLGDGRPRAGPPPGHRRRTVSRSSGSTDPADARRGQVAPGSEPASASSWPIRPTSTLPPDRTTATRSPSLIGHAAGEDRREGGRAGRFEDLLQALDARSASRPGSSGRRAG